MIFDWIAHYRTQNCSMIDISIPMYLKHICQHTFDWTLNRDISMTKDNIVKKNQRQVANGNFSTVRNILNNKYLFLWAITW